MRSNNHPAADGQEANLPGTQGAESEAVALSPGTMPLEDRSTAWQVHGETPIYDSEWIRLTSCDVETPDGQRFDHHKVVLKAAAVVAMVDKDERVYMMWRHRFPSNIWNWELPGGLLDPGESADDAGKRELLEESGFVVDGAFEHVASFEPMIGMVTSPHDIYIARDVRKVAEPTEVNEAQRVAWIPLDDMLGLIAQGKIANSGTLVAVLYLLATRKGQDR
ncbi:NUDIX hydrolase [Streptomyces tropicalis]|uniref:NUDIX hydrolase n=1 Tax=Streptomyces tropicalis TaxID=3034234 RepID=A0ABT6AFF3_9ACTN|nr:NUDIX hydrolase [Streptomyces tropicalis]MDF3303213.1 NUDIX hydrolase [Streptomyces tropicalis]